MAYFAPKAGGASQFLFALSNIKWVFFFAIALASASVGGFERKFMIIFVAEVFFGLGAFFADFRTPFILAMVAYLTQVRRTSLRSVGRLGVLFAALVTLAGVWTSVKNDVRAEIHSDVGSQVVTGSYFDRVLVLGELVLELEKKEVEAGIADTFRRRGYIEYFAATLEHVPEYVPHTGGTIVVDALTRPFTPRFLFPNKSIVDDSARTNLYTGVSVAGFESGTSISIGWPGEFYIEFGRFGMMAMAFTFGLLIGGLPMLLRVTIQLPSFLILALTTNIAFLVLAVETSITKSLGGVIIHIIIFTAVCRVFPRTVLSFSPKSHICQK